MKNKKSLFGIFLIGVAMFSMVGCAFKNKDKLVNLNIDNLYYVKIESYNEKSADENIRIEIDFDEGTICSGYMSEFLNRDDALPEVKELTEEQSKELKEYIIEYSYTVQDKEEDYWPDTDEYPDMNRLFVYDVRYDEERYKEDGALCYPDGWAEFIEVLMTY